MGKIAFLYPGQGSQKVGMGSDLQKDAPDLFQHYLSASDRVAELPITQYCLEGPFEILSQTHITQPALFAHSLALTEYAFNSGLFPDLVTGHSLGEYTAAVASGVLSFEEGMQLVCRRGRLMYQVQEENPGAMAAVLGISIKDLKQICALVSERETVVIANWNAPTQLVISGTEDGIEQAIQIIRARGIGRIIRLQVRGGFHSPLMQSVQQTLALTMQSLTWNNAHIPLFATVAGQVLTDGLHIRQSLLTQITSPIQWMMCIESLVQDGYDTFLEIGASQVLTRLTRQIAPAVTAITVDTLEKMTSMVKQYGTRSAQRYR